MASKKTCSIGDCKKIMSARLMCSTHYRRWKLYGDPNVLLRDAANPSMTTYKMISKKGHPNASITGLMPEHRFIMSEYLGRPLLPEENVHHINGNKRDNRIENLELWNTKQPKGQRIEDKVFYAIEILNAYAPELLNKIKVEVSS